MKKHRRADTLIHLGDHAGFEDALRSCRKLMMSYLWAFPFLGILALRVDFWAKGALSLILIAVVGLLVVLKIARFFIKVQLVLDRERQQLLLRRQIFGMTHLKSLAGVEDLWAVVTAGEVPAAPVNYWWDYVTLLITKSGQRFRAASHGASFLKAERATRRLGEELGVEIFPGKEDHKVEVVMGEGRPELRFHEFHLKAADCLAVVFWAVMIFLTPILAWVLLYL